MLRPIVVDTVNRVIVSVPISFDYTDHISKIKLTKKATTIFISEEKFSGLKPVSANFNTNTPTKPQLLKFVGMQSLIKSCSDNAEDIKSRLLSIYLQIADKKNFDRTTIMKMDFMKLKDNFMEFLKVDSLIKTVEEYSSNQKLKPLRRNFDAFVIDRNIYTHGQLCFLHPDSELVIEYIDNHSRKKQYAYINSEILISYNNFYKEILKLISTFNKTRKK